MTQGRIERNHIGVIRTVTVALLIDLLAFTIILPLFPRLLNFYRQQEGGSKETLLGYMLQILEHYKQLFAIRHHSTEDKWDTVLLGGFIGSMFSLLQFFISPLIGRSSDTLGRRKVLLFTMIGNILSTAVWLFARSFSLFLLARVIAGLSEGNVQLSIAIISDVTTAEHRSRSLALVGLCFAMAFTIGPALGAYFASVDLTQLYPATMNWNIYPFSTPALVALALLTLETAYIYRQLPETLGHQQVTIDKSSELPSKEDEVTDNIERHANLRLFKLIHGIHLFLFSGMEFTLVFLTFDVLDYSNMQQGTLLGYMGILSALIQGGYVRRRVQRMGEKALVIQGMAACAVGLTLLSIMPFSRTNAVKWLYAGVSCLALTSGTVVNCLTGLASLQCKEGHYDLAKGRALGEFRSAGQLGRAFGPITACGVYWMAGPTLCYGIGALVMTGIAIFTNVYVPSSKKKSQ